MVRRSARARGLDFHGYELAVTALDQMAVNHSGLDGMVLPHCECPHCPVCVLEENLGRRGDVTGAVAFAGEARHAQLQELEQNGDDEARVRYAAILCACGRHGGRLTLN